MKAWATISPHIDKYVAGDADSCPVCAALAAQLISFCMQLQQIFLWQAHEGMSASDAAALRGQLADAMREAPSIFATAATLQHSGTTAASEGERQRLATERRRLQAEQRQLEADREAALAAAGSSAPSCKLRNSGRVQTPQQPGLS
jgi:hypothetical protein